MQKKNQTIKNIRLLGHEPQIHYICENLNDEDYAYKLELIIIQLAVKTFGYHITNRIGVDLRPPCRKGTKMTASARAKISEAFKETHI